MTYNLFSRTFNLALSIYLSIFAEITKYDQNISVLTSTVKFEL